MPAEFNATEPSSNDLNDLEGLLSEAVAYNQRNDFHARASWYGGMLRAIRTLRLQVKTYQEELLKQEEQHDLEDDETVEDLVVNFVERIRNAQ